ncbi:MAG: hypothetical protein IJX89_01075 [Alphaproteobacteria bacterium]|nr:hypothetical protein [Alphaproteobacteria bacterium]
MNVQSNIAEKQQKFIIPIDEKTTKILSVGDRKIIVDAYLKLFYGFTCVNWTNKYSLGRAWQTSLAQCGAFIQTKNKTNPAAKYLGSMFESHKKYWSRIIMTHNNSENKISADDKKIKQMREYGLAMIHQAMDSINLVLGRYNARAEQIITQEQIQNKEQAQPAKTQAQAQAKPQPQKQATPQSATQPQEQNMVLAVKPQEQAQTKPKPVPQTQIAQPVAQARPAVQTKPVVRPVAKPAVKPQARPIAQPQKPASPQTSAKKENFVAAQQRIEVRAAQIKLTIQQQQLQIIALNKFHQRAA